MEQRIDKQKVIELILTNHVALAIDIMHLGCSSMEIVRLLEDLRISYRVSVAICTYLLEIESWIVQPEKGSDERHVWDKIVTYAEVKAYEKKKIPSECHHLHFHWDQQGIVQRNGNY